MRSSFADDRLSKDILTALASSDRRSALAAWQHSPRFDEWYMFLSYCSDFLPKNFFVRKNVASIDPICILFVSDDSCVQVCSCRTTLDAVARRHAVNYGTLLLHHFADSPRLLTPQAVARYIIKLVHWAYTQANESTPPVVRMTYAKLMRSCEPCLRSLSDVLKEGTMVFYLHLS